MGVVDYYDLHTQALTKASKRAFCSENFICPHLL
jgi:hypothetical protein